MANQTKSLPWSADTVGSLTSADVKVAGFEFVDFAGAADACEIQDGSGDTVWKGTGDAPKSSFSCPIWVQGLQLASIAAGAKVIIYVV
jgi:hypothetical protein